MHKIQALNQMWWARAHFFEAIKRERARGHLDRADEIKRELQDFEAAYKALEKAT